jgi:hypothetical protein
MTTPIAGEVRWQECCGANSTLQQPKRTATGAIGVRCHHGVLVDGHEAVFAPCRNHYTVAGQGKGCIV